MSSKQYEVQQKDTWIDAIPIPTTHTVVITDKASGEEYKATATTVERAKELAWDKVDASKK